MDRDTTNKNPLVLVTGGNGFIGSHLCRALLSKGFRVRIFDLPGTAGDAVADLDVEQHPGSVLEPEDLNRAMTGVDAVYHLAAKVADWGPIDQFYALNVQSTKNVLAAMKHAKTHHMILMSSLAIHGWSSHVNEDETCPRDVPGSYPYGRTKRMAENVVMAADKRGEVKATIIRPGFVPFGPYDRTSFADLAYHMARGHLALVGGGEKKVCISYVENLATGMALACLNEKAFGETFVMVDDGVYSWKDFFTLMADKLGIKAPKRSIPAGPLYAVAWLIDRLWMVAGAKNIPILTRYRININRHDFHFQSDKAKKVLGYNPAISAADGMERTARWYRETMNDPLVPGEL